MEKVIRRKENVLNKIKPSYPTKDKINFAEIDVTPMKIEVMAPAIVAIIIVACLLSKFLVVDRLIAYKKQAADVASMESELQAAYDKIDSYSDMEEKYAHYTYSGMTPDEMALQDRVAVVELINKYILTKAEVGAWTITGNEVNIPITGVSFQEVGAIAAELEKPGRDPRDEAQAPVLRSDVMEMSDLKPDMELKGTVRNIVDFGAFVDIGVHQDGLVHISQLSDRYVKHPLDVVKVGDIVDVRVLSVDEKRGKISLTMKRK